jgi:hypothetical protein
MRARFPFLILALWVVGCDGEMTGDDDSSGSADAAPGSADAAPGTPDAAPATPDAGPQPGDLLACIDYPQQKQDNAGAPGDILKDIETHLPASYGDQYRFEDDEITWGHETTHGVNSDVRNYHNNSGKRANGLYLLGDCGVIVVEPDILKSAVAPYVPQVLRGFRYSTYITGQTAWDDMPTYIMDEFVAYTNGGAVGVELVQKGLWNHQWQDGVAGQLEFVVYALALGMAVEDGDPTYWATEPQLRELIAHEIRRAMDIFALGRAMPAFEYDVQDTYLQELRTSSQAAEMREWVKETYGAEWAMEVLGF